LREELGREPVDPIVSGRAIRAAPSVRTAASRGASRKRLTAPVSQKAVLFPARRGAALWCFSGQRAEALIVEVRRASDGMQHSRPHLHDRGDLRPGRCPHDVDDLKQPRPRVIAERDLVAKLHGPRHQRNTEALAAGVSTFELSRVMGTSLAMIDIHCGHLARDSEESIRARLDARSRQSGAYLASEGEGED
jgi:hypothetical protein